DINNKEYRELMAYADTISGMCLTNAGAEAQHHIGIIINDYLKDLSHGEILSFVYSIFCKYMIYVILECFEDIIILFKFYIPEDKTLPKGYQAYYMMKNFLEDIDFLVTPYSINLDEQLKANIKDKLVFDLPLTTADGLKEIFENSV